MVFPSFVARPVVATDIPRTEPAPLSRQPIPQLKSWYRLNCGVAMTDGSLPRADAMLPPSGPGLMDRLIGAVLGRVIKGGPRPEELTEGIRASRMQSGHEQNPDV